MTRRTDGTALFRRRRFVEPHQRRRLFRRLAKPFAAAVALVGVPAAFTYWALTSEHFLVSELAVGTTGRVSPAWAEEQLEPLLGNHLVSIDLADVEERLSGHPWIEAVEMRRELPGRVEVWIREKQPAALWNEDGELRFLDRSGAEIAALDAGFGVVDLPVLNAAPEASPSGREPAARVAAMRVAGEWQRLRPQDSISQVEIVTPRDFRLVIASLPFAVLVTAGRVASAVAGLEKARAWLSRNSTNTNNGPSRPQRVAVVDLRFSRQIVFQPAAGPPHEEG